MPKKPGRKKTMAEMNIVQAINNALELEMKNDESVVVLGEDVGVDGGVFRVTDGLIDKFGEERVIDSPLAEAGIVGTSVGMAINGLKPVAEMQFSGFIYPAMQEVISHAARIRNRTRGVLTCPLVVRLPYGGGIRALEHHSESMEAMFGHIQGIKTVVASNPYNAKGLLIAAIRDPDPVLYMEPKRMYRAMKQDIPDEAYTVPIGETNVVKQGDDITLVSWGAQMEVAQEAIESLGNVSVELIDVQTIYPLDYKPIVESVKKTGKCVILHEAARNFGPAGEIIALLNEHAFTSLEAPIKRVTGYNVPFPLALSENYYLPSAYRVAKAIKEVINY